MKCSTTSQRDHLNGLSGKKNKKQNTEDDPREKVQHQTQPCSSLKIARCEILDDISLSRLPSDPCGFTAKTEDDFYFMKFGKSV